MPEEGDYLLTHVGFSHEKPTFTLSQATSFYDTAPLGEVLSLTFDLSQRYCIGWRDIQSGERFVCPQQQATDQKYDQCAGCQKKTGFNPAFYHASSVSPQQQARNDQPHSLYLASFGGGVIKVGITHSARGKHRLLEQGARQAILLETFATAQIARHYEARIATLTGIAETVSLRQKLNLLSASPDVDALQHAQRRINQELDLSFDGYELISLDSYYFPVSTPDLSHAHDLTNQARISGTTIGSLGTVLFTKYDDELFFLPLKKFVGYRVMFRKTAEAIDIPVRQLTLF